MCGNVRIVRVKHRDTVYLRNRYNLPIKFYFLPFFFRVRASALVPFCACGYFQISEFYRRSFVEWFDPKSGAFANLHQIVGSVLTRQNQKLR